MTVHEEILMAARRLCSVRGSWTFAPSEIVNALPHLNERSVRTHVTSRCCVNAPSHHAHRWPYFRRIGRGLYELQPRYREAELPEAAETAAEYELTTVAPRESIHVVVVESEGQFVAECLEIAIVTQGATLDETLANLREACELYMADEDMDLLGLVANPRLLVTLDVPAGQP